MVRQGLGIGVFPDWMGDAEPAFERARVGSTPITFPIWLMAHREVRSSARVRLVYDMLADDDRAALARDLARERAELLDRHLFGPFRGRDADGAQAVLDLRRQRRAARRAASCGAG